MTFSLSKVSWSPFSRISGNTPFLSRPTNITYIIGGLFLLSALGWIIKRVTGLNFRSIVPFSEVGNKALRLFWQVFPSSQKPDPKATTPPTTQAGTPFFPNSQKPDPKTTTPSTTQAGTPSENREMALISVESSNEQLLQMMIFAKGDDGQLYFDYENPQNQAIRNHLELRIQHGFTQHAKEGEVQVARALAPLFALAKSDPDRFMVLVKSVIWTSRYCPRFTVAVLEEIEWPSEKLKQEKLPACLAGYIMRRCLSWQNGSIEIEGPSSSKESTYFRTFRLVVVTKDIFGLRNFVKNPKPLSPFLAQGMGIAFRQCAKAIVEDLKQKHNDRKIDDEIRIGLNLVMGQFMECRFPASMVAPVLPYLKEVPGLVGLEMTDIGDLEPVTTEDGQKTEIGDAFRDEDVSALLAVLRTNPFLFHVKINTNGMTQEVETQFLQEWQSILKDRRRPTIEGLVSAGSS